MIYGTNELFSQTHAKNTGPNGFKDLADCLKYKRELSVDSMSSVLLLV